MALDSSLHGKGLGRSLLHKAKDRNTELNGWVIDNNDEPKENGNYASPIGFYKKNGFTIHTEDKIVKNGISGIRVSWIR